VAEDVSLRNEVEVLRANQHPNIIRLVGTIVVSESTPVLAGIILPFYAQGSLDNYITSR
jgi:hypothetical protein